MKGKSFFDTSVLVAALVVEHPHHAVAASLLNDVFSRKAAAFISAHGMAELYSVLTRAPEPLSIHPADAWRMIETSLLPHVDVVSLNGAEYREVVEECSRNGWLGGQVYDLLHIHAARKANCARLYTFNVKHFRALASGASFTGAITAP